MTASEIRAVWNRVVHLECQGRPNIEPGQQNLVVASEQPAEFAALEIAAQLSELNYWLSLFYEHRS